MCKNFMGYRGKSSSREDDIKLVYNYNSSEKMDGIYCLQGCSNTSKSVRWVVMGI